MLLAGNRLPEALRVGETALDLAQRAFPENHPSLALSYQRLGQIHDQRGNEGEARAFLGKALDVISEHTEMVGVADASNGDTSLVSLLRNSF